PGEIDREGGAATGAQIAMAALGGQLQVLRIVVPAAQDDQVLQAAGEEQLPRGDEAEVPGAQERAGAVGEMGAERRRRLLRPLPVPLGDARAAHPDLADAAGRTRLSRLRIDG